MEDASVPGHPFVHTECSRCEGPLKCLTAYSNDWDDHFTRGQPHQEKGGRPDFSEVHPRSRHLPNSLHQRHWRGLCTY